MSRMVFGKTDEANMPKPDPAEKKKGERGGTERGTERGKKKKKKYAPTEVARIGEGREKGTEG